MTQRSRIIAKNLIVAATIGLAAFASWAFTDFRAPMIEVASAVSQRG